MEEAFVGSEKGDCGSRSAPDSSFAAGRRPPPLGEPPAAQDATILLAMTAHASATLGAYCRIVVGDARTRGEQCEAAREVAYRWLSGRQDRVALYGRRAWNAHMAQPYLEEPTTDVDMIVLEPQEFQTSRFSLSMALRRGVPDGARLIHTYVKQHQDGRGATMTAELGGVPVVDLSVRFVRGDLCISATRAAQGPPYCIPEPHCVLRMVGSRPVSVLRVPVMMQMLAAETQAGTWRARRATMQMLKVDAMARAGWLLPDQGTAGTPGTDPFRFLRRPADTFAAGLPNSGPAARPCGASSAGTASGSAALPCATRGSAEGSVEDSPVTRDATAATAAEGTPAAALAAAGRPAERPPEPAEKEYGRPAELRRTALYLRAEWTPSDAKVSASSSCETRFCEAPASSGYGGTSPKSQGVLYDRWIHLLRRHAQRVATLDELKEATLWLPCVEGDPVSAWCERIMACGSLEAARQALLAEDVRHDGGRP